MWFYDLLSVLLHCGALTCQTWKLGGHLELVGHENSSEGLGASQLLKTYSKGKEPPSAAIGTQYLRVSILLALRDWYLSSHGICWELHANLAHISSCSHLHNVICHHGKTKTCTPHCWWSGIPSSIHCTWELVCHVSQCWFWHCTKSMYWVALPNIFWQSWLAIVQYANGKKNNESLTLMWYVPHYAMQKPKILLYTPF